MRPHIRTLHAVAALVTGAGFLAVSAAAVAAPGKAGHTHDTTAIGEPAKATAKTRTVQVEMGDNYYEPETIAVKAGETVRFVVRNTGEFLHEFNIGTADACGPPEGNGHDGGPRHADETGVNEEMMKMDHSGMPDMGHSMKHDDPNSVLVEPGQTRELVWKFSKQATIEFACNMPGHYESGMVARSRSSAEGRPMHEPSRGLSAAPPSGSPERRAWRASSRSIRAAASSRPPTGAWTLP
ncbi:cupredoxin domain-containing protein [Skermanella pratensis]|uniref:cupredoxin domain-containing protein n=1 Tax=Skermanella pratensis TaxID=2233999 RepID=UPI001FE855D6|nr:cupredoxin domain-containing protein [Skermanella pratensis]